LSHLHIDDVYNRSPVEIIQVELAMKLESGIDQIHASFTYRDSTSLRSTYAASMPLSKRRLRERADEALTAIYQTKRESAGSATGNEVPGGKVAGKPRGQRCAI